MHFSLCNKVYFLIHKLVLKSYEAIQCRAFRKLELGHQVTMLDFIYMEGESMLMHKVKSF